MQTLSVAPRLFRPLPGSTVCPLEDSLVWVDTRQGHLAVLNQTASLIWALGAGGESLQEVAEELSARCGISHEQAFTDLVQITQQWANAGLLAGHARPAETPAEVIAPSGQSVLRIHRQVIGHCVEFRYFSGDLADAVEPALAAFKVVPANMAVVTRRLDIFHSGPSIAVTGTNVAPGTCPGLDSLKRLVIAQLALDCLDQADLFAVFHAGAVGNATRCVLLPGASGMGKSTLTLALVQSGLSLLSDDFVPFNQQTGCARPFPLALSVKSGSWEIASQLFPELRDQPEVQYGERLVRYLPLSERTAPHTLPVAGLVFPRYVAGQPLRARRISAVTAMQKLMETSTWWRPPINVAEFLGFLERLEQWPRWELEYSSLPQATDWIRANCLS